MFAHTIGFTAELNGADTIPNNIYAVFELGFALVAATIVAASVHGRVNLHGFLFFIFAWHLAVYAPVAHAVWNYNGVLFTNYVTDFAGGLVVHILASSTSLALHLVLGKDTIPKPGAVADPEKALYLSFLVWFLWFGFNSGKSHDASQVAAQSIVNTIAAGIISVLTAFLYNLIFEKPFTSVTIVNALIIGLVAITPAAGFVTVGGALVIALFSYVAVAFISNFLAGEGNKANEPFSVLLIHSIAGTTGFIWTTIISYKFVNLKGNNGLTHGRGVPLGYHIAACLAVWAASFIANFILAFICNLLVPIGETGSEYVYKAEENNHVEAAEPVSVPHQDDVVKEKQSGLELSAV